MDGKSAKALAEKEKCELLDVKFSDLLGLWQHFTVPIDALTFTEKDFFPFDGSSIRGFQEIDESDMYLIPDYSTVFVDPFSTKSISIICDVYDPVKKEYYSKDCRFIARKAESYLKSTGIADTAYFGPEAEFFIFDEIRYEQNEFSAYYFVDSAEGIWNSGKAGDGNGGRNLAYKPRYKEGYFPTAPHDSVHEIRNEIVLTMRRCGITVEKHHHEVATAGQCEVGMKYDSLVRAADKLMLYKYIVKNVARKHGKVATFMPKPLFNDNGSGMHTHQSLWKDGKNIFAGDCYAGLNETALYYIGGLLDHARALAAILSPTTNSYKRLVPGFEAPVNLAYSYRNRSAAVRIPVVEEGNTAAVRIEYRPPDPSCNPYLAFAAMLMAGLDGIKRKIHPGDAINENIYKMPKEKAAKIRTLPATLEEALEELENDHKFLLEGDVFTKDVLETWIEYKRKKEIEAVRLRPHPWEYYLYHDV
jgi:glutamine synthetase